MAIRAHKTEIKMNSSTQSKKYPRIFFANPLTILIPFMSTFVAVVPVFRSIFSFLRISFRASTTEQWCCGCCVRSQINQTKKKIRLASIYGTSEHLNGVSKASDANVFIGTNEKKTAKWHQKQQYKLNVAERQWSKLFEEEMILGKSRIIYVACDWVKTNRARAKKLFRCNNERESPFTGFCDNFCFFAGYFPSKTLAFVTVCAGNLLLFQSVALFFSRTLKKTSFFSVSLFLLCSIWISETIESDEKSHASVINRNSKSKSWLAHGTAQKKAK